jgi:hypothetical protein
MKPPGRAYGNNTSVRRRAEIDQVYLALTQNDLRWRGYADFRLGKPEPETALPIGYEEGRLIAAELSIYGQLPEWLHWWAPPTTLIDLIYRWQADNPGGSAIPPEFAVKE